MTIKSKLKNAARIGVASLGLAGLLGSGTSCQMTPQEEREAFSMLLPLGVLAQTNPNSTPQDRSLGAGLSAMGQMAHERNVAEAGRSEVNVNVYDSQSQQSQQPYNLEEDLKKVKFYTCIKDNPNDKREMFYRDESFEVHADMGETHIPPGQIDNYVECLDGNFKGDICHKGILMCAGEFKAKLFTEGNRWRVYWFYNGRKIGSYEFIILDRPNSNKKPEEKKE